MNPNPIPQPSKVEFTSHDGKVILFHAVVAAAQIALVSLGAYHFGKYDATIALIVQVVAEALRRLVY